MHGSEGSSVVFLGVLGDLTVHFGNLGDFGKESTTFEISLNKPYHTKVIPKTTLSNETASPTPASVPENRRGGEACRHSAYRAPLRRNIHRGSGTC